MLNKISKNMSNTIFFDSISKQLKWHILSNSMEHIQTIIKNPKFDINTILPNGLTALHFAIQLKNEYLINYLLVKGANVNGLNAEGDTAINYFLQTYQDSAIGARILINLINSNAADINHIDSFNMRPLETVFHLKQLQFLDILLQSNAANDHSSYNAVRQHKKMNAILHLAIAYKYHDILDILLNNYINLEIENSRGKTALHVAMTDHQLSTIRLLLDYNAKFDEHNYFVKNYIENLCDNYAKTFLAHLFYHSTKRNQSNAINNINNYRSTIFSNYQLELNCMHTKTFIDNQTYYEILLDDYKRLAFKNLPSFMHKFIKKQYILKVFPLFGDILIEKIELAQHRKLNSDQAFIKLNYIIVKTVKLICLPKNIVTLIIISLTDKDLCDLIEHCPI